MTKSVWELKTARRTWNCEVCHEEVDSVYHMLGSRILCPRHRNIAGYIKALFSRRSD